MDTAFCLLAGGKSSRFKKDKSQACLNGKRLIDYALELLSNYTKTVYLSCGYDKNRGELAELNHPKIIKIYDTKPFLGPLCGIYNMLKSVKAEYYLFLGVDMPFITKNMVNTLLEQAENNIFASIFECGGRITPLPLMVNNSAVEFFKNRPCDNGSIKDLIRFKETKKIILNDCDNLLNINTQEDLKKAQERLSI